MGVTSNWGHPQGHHARRPPTTPPPVMISFPWNVIDITWNVSPFEFLCSFVSLVLNNTRGLLFKLLYHVLWVNKHLLNLNLRILWWYDEGYKVKKAWWSDGRTDGQAEWTYSQSCLVAAKNVKLNRGLPVDNRRSFSFIPYLLWYPGGQELGYLILELYIKSY